MIWNFVFNAANAQRALTSLGSHYSQLFDQMTGRLGDTISKWNVWQKMFDYMVGLTKELINESRELIAISTKYDIPIKKMGEFQMMAQAAGQSLGQVARNFRFLEMNVSRALLKPGGPQYQAFRELGVSQDELAAGASNTAYIMDIVRSKVMSIGDEERRNNFLQTIFGANWQNMLVLIELSAEAQKEMSDAAYEYGDAQTASLALIEKQFAEIAQDLKPTAAILAQTFAVLVTLLTIIVQSLALAGVYIKDLIIDAIKVGIGILQGQIAILLKVTNFVLNKIGGGSELLQEMERQFENSAKENVGGTIKKRIQTGLGFDDPKFRKGTDNLVTNYGRLGQNFRALGYSMGIGDEEKDKADDEKDITRRRAGMAMLTEERKRQIAELEEYDKLLEKNGKLTAKQEHDRVVAGNRYRALQRDIQEASEGLNEAEEDYRKKYGKAFAKEGDSSNKPRTAEEIKNELDALKSQRELDLKRTMALTPKVAEMESAMAVTKAYQEQLNIAHEINDLIKNNAWTVQQQTEYSKKAQQAEINLIEKQKEHALFLKKQAIARAEAERGRKESTIEMMQERQQTFMARQGMTGMDKQGVKVSQAIDKMVRDQEQLDRVLKDETKNQADREAAKKQVDSSAIKAQQELDKLSLMQFQYGASDAAKKGMGGGIDIRENQLTVAKSQLEILKKQLDLMYKSYGLSPADYGGTPMIMEGSIYARGK
jgi:hypothetical protein